PPAATDRPGAPRLSRALPSGRGLTMTTVLATPTDIPRRERIGQWVDQHSGPLMVLPAVIILLAFAIFPLIVSAYLSLSRFALAAGIFKLTFVGLANFQRLLTGSQQYHLLGSFKPFGVTEWSLLGLVLILLAAWLVSYAARHFSLAGFLGRLVT